MALSLTQPWASLVIDGRKHVETRSWKTRYRGPLAIHATREADHSACIEFGYDPATIPLRAVLGTARLVDCVQFLALFPPAGRFGAEEMKYGDFSPGRFGFVLESACKFAKPLPARGSFGLWEWLG